MVSRASIGLAVVLLSGPLSAQQPFPRVPLTLAAEEADAGFAKHLAQLEAAAAACDLAAVHAMVAPSFFKGRDFGGTFDLSRSHIENFDAALFFGGEGGGSVPCDHPGWSELAALAEAPSHAWECGLGVCHLCGPAIPAPAAAEPPPHFEELGWVGITGTDVNVRAAPSTSAAAIDVLSLEAVPNLCVTGAGACPEGWVKVATPSGRTGYVAAAFVSFFLPTRLCHATDSRGRWWISGLIGGGD